VRALVSASSGTQTATYEYGPFGEVLRAEGVAASSNPIRFSTKYQDQETDLLYYGYRYYNPSIGRWLGRDPGEEWDGPNVYAFVHNMSANLIDRNGLESWAFAPYFHYQNGQWVYRRPFVGRPSTPAMPFALWRSFLTSPVMRFTSMGFVPQVNQFNDTAWFDQNRPNAVGKAKEYFKFEIEAQRRMLCTGKALVRIEDFNVGPQWAGNRGRNEAQLGDPQQSPNELRFYLGFFGFRLSDNITVTRSGNRLKYEGRIDLIDIYGDQEKYSGRFLHGAFVPIFGNEHEVILGSWTIRGIIYCCD